MTKPDPKERLEELIQAFRDHYEVASSLQDDDEDLDELVDTEEQLQDAFFRYDNALFSRYRVELPFDIYDEDETDDDEEEDELPAVDDLSDDENFEICHLYLENEE